YRADDERGWVICRVLSFLDSAFFDDVRQSKEHYEHASIELVAEREGEIVGLIDVECETEPGAVCELRPGPGRNDLAPRGAARQSASGVASALLREAEIRARGTGIVRFEAWTRDDRAARTWYESRGFELIDPVTLFAHYVGDDPETVRTRFRRVHENVLYELRFGS
ncbi:MAG TPA: GNAT family N-acetyltransferase, partial [Gaiellaceae bacterium]